MDYRTKGVCSQSIHFDMFPSLADVTVTCREFPIWLKEWM